MADGCALFSACRGWSAGTVMWLLRGVAPSLAPGGYSVQLLHRHRLQQAWYRPCLAHRVWSSSIACYSPRDVQEILPAAHQLQSHSLLPAPSGLACLCMQCHLCGPRDTSR